ncbi:MAG TPA: tRNA pseudouridine(55) synthase TruB [Bacteroidetes bacterium]|nr:MAG: tRNA pseudouridine(55) synthase TruB [Ignavibacteria bacterium GWC2_56_12]HAV23837.1 tRNA pseudouridine(55) synthase TruB [Bacteroidota bacterium]
MTQSWDFNVLGEVLQVDKPQAWTSFDVVRKVRNLFHIRKIGHAGTLDPLATGLLVLCTGPKTKLITTYVGYDKEYIGTFRLGIRTASFDMETPVEEERPWSHISSAVVEEAVKAFLGPQDQMPPMYSAAKYKGRALYKYARQGKSIERVPRQVDISSIETTHVSLPDVHFRLVCSKGTYVRSLVHDIGERLGCGATLTSLRRTRVGPWSVGDAWTMEQLEEARQLLHAETYEVRPTS